MKRNTFFIALFLFVTSLVAQENEQSLKKGQVLTNPVMATAINYNTIATVLTNVDADLWQGKSWKQQAGATEVLFSTGEYKNNTNYRLESPVISLPKLKSKAERLNLYFQEKYELESGYDEAEVRISSDGGKSWQVVSLRSGKSDLRTSVVNLTAFAGKEVQLAFVLNTDDSNTYGGWDIKSVSLKHEALTKYSKSSSVNTWKDNRFMLKGASTTGLTGNLTNLDAQKFPRFIFANLNVSEDGMPIDNLDETNFTITETIQGVTSKVDKDFTFKVYAPSNDTIRKAVDIVFLMDNSGSMRQEQAAVAANVASFASDLDSRGYDYRMGMCRFGQAANSGDPLFHNNAGWYSSSSAFVSEWTSVMTIDGGNEPSWDALYYSSSHYSFRPEAQKVFILITDEDITGGYHNITYCDIQDRQVVIDKLQETGVTTYTLVSNGSYYESDFGVIADSTGGKSYLITDPFNSILDDIGTEIENTYTVRYTPTSPMFDGEQRDVAITVAYNGKSVVLEGNYTPGAAPIVERTDATLDIHKQAQQKKLAIEIEVKVMDLIAPLTQSVSLFYKNVSGTEYVEVAMTGGGSDGLWRGEIPAAEVLDPGIQYYIKATDGQSTTTAPEFINKEGYPWSFAVLPNLPPEIKGTPVVGNLQVGDVINFTAEAVDNTLSIDKVFVYVRKNNDLSFVAYEMNSSVGNTYVYNGLSIEEGITEYFFSAIDNFGVSSFDHTETNPYVITSNVPWPVYTSSPYKHTIGLGGFDFSAFPPMWTADVAIGGASISVGDYIGVFYQDQSIEKCGGFFAWTGAPNASFFVYGDDPATAEKDGFANGESFTFKIFRQSDGVQYDAEHVFKASSLNTSFANSGKTSVASVKAFYAQFVNLKKDLNLWSSYLYPKDLSFDAIFAGNSNVISVKDKQGNTWMPTGGAANTLTDYTPGYGYELSAVSGQVVRIDGNAIDWSQWPVSLIGNEESTLIGCPYESAENVEAVFSSYTSNIYVVDKYVNDGTGFITIESYSPMYGMNFWVDKNMRSGEAYHAFALQPDPAFVFPAATGAYPKSSRVFDDYSNQRVRSIDAYMHVMLPGNIGNLEALEGSEIRAYNSEGKLVGSTSLNTSGSMLIIDGYEMAEGSDFELRLWSPVAMEERIVEVTSWASGDGSYENLKAAVVDQISLDDLAEKGVALEVFPNPVKEKLNVSLILGSTQEVTVKLYGLNGQLIVEIPSREYQTGTYIVDVPIGGVASGVYYLQVRKGDDVVVKRVVISE